jgi:hypothetical protein
MQGFINYFAMHFEDSENNLFVNYITISNNTKSNERVVHLLIAIHICTVPNTLYLRNLN